MSKRLLLLFLIIAAVIGGVIGLIGALNVERESAADEIRMQDKSTEWQNAHPEELKRAWEDIDRYHDR